MQKIELNFDNIAQFMSEFKSSEEIEWETRYSGFYSKSVGEFTPEQLKFKQDCDMKSGMNGMTQPENVENHNDEPTRNCKEETSGVATQKRHRDDLKKVKVLINVIYDTMKVYGYSDKAATPDKGRSNRCKTEKDQAKLFNLYMEYVEHNGKGSWKDLFKYKINAFFSWVMKQEVPPSPKGIEDYPDLKNPELLCYGRGKRFIRKMYRNWTTLESFAQSVAQSKKGAPPVSKEMVEEAEMKSYLHLTTPRPDSPDFQICGPHYSHVINKETVCFQLRRTMREMFAGKAPSWDELTQPFVPSTSSQYNYSRKRFGAVGAYLEMPFLEQFYSKLSKISKTISPVLLKEQLTELYGLCGIEDQKKLDDDFENIIVKGTIGLVYDGEELCYFWRNTVFPGLLLEALKEEPRTVIIGLPEPLKVRTITAGPPLTYSVLKPVQEWLWRNLKKHSVFQLIGTPVTSDIVRKQLGRLGPFEEFVSGDYKASTDNLHSWVSECLLEELIKIWKESSVDSFNQHVDEFSKLMKSALTGHKILNPECKGIYQSRRDLLTDEDFKQQKEGQLMGSIISFPFLCLANAALCRWALEISENSRFRLSDKGCRRTDLARLLINGDDCVFPCDVFGGFSTWQQITAFGGLESSVGKTFRSREFLTINSCQYSYKETASDWELASGDESQRDFNYVEVKYVNLGLIYGQKKDGIRGKPFFRLGSVHRDLWKTCPSELFSRATKLFIKYNTISRKIFNRDGELIEDFFSDMNNAGVPFYMPTWLGGLGMIPPVEFKFKDWDLRAAAFIRSNMNGFTPRLIKDESEWQFHNLVAKDLKDFKFLDNQNFRKVEFDGTERLLSEEYDKLYNLCVVDQLLRHSKEELLNEFDEDAMRVCQIRDARYNAKLWKILRQDPGFHMKVLNKDPMDPADLLPEKKIFPLSCFDGRIARNRSLGPVEVNNLL